MSQNTILSTETNQSLDSNIALKDIRSLATRDPKKAKVQALYYIKQHKDDMDAYYCYGKIEESLGNFEDAKEAFSIVAASKGSNKYNAIIKLGIIAKKQGDVETAKKYLLYAINHSPKEEKLAYMTLSAIYRNKKQYKEALELLTRIKSRSNDVREELAMIFSSQGKYREALAELNQIKSQNKIYSRTLAVEKAKLAIKLKDFATAEYHILEAKDTKAIDPIYYRAMYQEAILLQAKKEYQQVEDICLDLISSSYDAEKGVNIVLGEAQEALGNYSAALKNYQIAANASTDANIRSNGHFHSGMLSFSLGDFCQAERSFKKIDANIGTINKIKIVKLVSIYLRQGRYIEAEELVRTSERSMVSLAGLGVVPIMISKWNNRPLPKRNPNNYLESQVIEYRSEDAIRHIKAHHQVRKKTASNFSKTIDIETLFDDIKLQMVDENMVYEDIFDIYEIDYPNAGYDQDDQLVHKIRVVAIPNTKDIITMYPSGKTGIKREGSIKYEIEDKRKVGSGQIAKFNARLAKSTAKK